MKVNFTTGMLYNKPYDNRYNYRQNASKFEAKYFSVPNYTVSFKQAKIPPEVYSYLEKQKAVLKEDFCSIENYDPQKLEGIQNGIKIFDGLSFPQIKYLISKLITIMVRRGCNNSCLHCYAGAQTPFFMKTNKFTDNVLFEDYKNLINGFKELNKRLGFNAFNCSGNDYIALFHDADSSTIYLQDKNGKTYDYADLSKMIHDVMPERTVLFDTAGWNINDKVTQKRMEDLVQKILATNKYDFLQFFVSINPFHSIISKSFELEKKGNREKARKLRKIYTDRMANVIFTFSPLLDRKNTINDPNAWVNTAMLNFIIRALKDSVKAESFDYTKRSTLDICDEIHQKLKKLYTEDINSLSPKVIKSTYYEYQKTKYLNNVETLFLENFRHSFLGDIHLTNSKLTEILDETTVNEYLDEIWEYLNRSADDVKLTGNGLIDVNGNFYMTNGIKTYPTNITLNYKNKDKPTAPLAPNLRDEIIMI